MQAGTVMSAAIIVGWLGWVLVLPGCAKHADFMQTRDQLTTISKTQDQDHQRVDAVVRRMEAIERSKDSKDPDVTKSRFDDMTARFQKLESRLAKLEETVSQSSAKSDPSPDVRAAKAVKPTPRWKPW